MTLNLPFQQVDVFTDRPFGGNSLAVFPDAESIPESLMQELAKEMNLSETTFVLPPLIPAASARIRIFTPGKELPFAGHPTIGTTYVLSRMGRLTLENGHGVLEEAVGPVPVRIEGEASDPDFIWMRHGPAVVGPPLNCLPQALAMIGLTQVDQLGLPLRVASTGVPFLFLALKDREAVDRAEPSQRNFERLPGAETANGLFVFAPDPDAGPGCVYSRMFGIPSLGMFEDPATGGASGPLAALLVMDGLAPTGAEIRMISEQGTKVGRRSIVHLSVTMNGAEITRIEIGGQVVPVLEGMVHLNQD